jgi:hypothetical protein
MIFLLRVLVSLPDGWADRQGLLSTLSGAEKTSDDVLAIWDPALRDRVRDGPIERDKRVPGQVIYKGLKPDGADILCDDSGGTSWLPGDRQIKVNPKDGY